MPPSRFYLVLGDLRFEVAWSVGREFQKAIELYGRSLEPFSLIEEQIR